MNIFVKLQVFIKNTTFTIKNFRRHKNMTVKERIEASQVYSFYARNPKIFVGTGLTAMDILDAFANAKIESKKIRCINKVCEYLKSNHTILCDDKLLREVVTKVYEKISYYERMEYDFSDIHPCCRPWYQRHFQVRMHEDSDL